MRPPHLRLFLLSAAAALLVACTGKQSQQTNTTDTFTAKVTATDLSNQRVTAFMEDAQGFMWIGTFRGLNCWNTHKFHQYYCTDREGDLPDNQINSLFCDSRQRLWVATIWGVATRNERDKFTLAPIDNGRYYCRQVIESTDGNIYAISNSRLALLDEKSFQFTTVNSSSMSRQALADRDYQYAFADRNGDLWLCDKKGRIDILGGKDYSLKLTINLDAATLSFCHDTDQSRLYVGTATGLRAVDVAQRREADLPTTLQGNSNVAQGYITVIHKHMGNLLICSSGGLYQYNPANGDMKRQHDSDFPFDVPEFVNALYTDSRGNLWIGSYDQGFTVVRAHERFNGDRLLTARLANKSVYSLAADSLDRVWIATLQGPLYLYDAAGGNFNEVAFGQTLSSHLAPVDITSVFADRGGNLWLASLFRHTVVRCRYDGKTLQETGYHTIGMPLSMSQDTDGNIWVCSGNGVVTCISPAGETAVQASLPGEDSFVADIAGMPNGEIWTAGLGQPILSVDRVKHQLGNTTLTTERLNALLNRSVFIPTDLHLDSFGTLWIGTVGNGLLRYDTATDSLTHVSGMPCTDIASINEDQQGNVWVSTQYGMASIDRTSKTVKAYYTADGIGGNQFYDRCSCTLSDGTLMFGGTHGVTAFKPTDLRKPSETPLVFDELLVHNTPVIPDNSPGIINKLLCLTPQVTLNHSQNGFCISFASLNYGSKDHDNYTYRLEGHDKYWIEAGHNNEAYYANLRPGTYTFRVKVDTPDNNHAKEISLKIKVKPSPWLSWWAIAIYLAIVAAVARTIYKARQDYLAERQQRQHAEQEREQLQRVNRINMSFFSNISHEFRTPLTMISGPVAQLQGSGNISGHERRLLDVVQHNVLRMLRLVNQMMDFGKLENDTLRLQVEHVDAMTYLRHTVETFAVNAADKGITLRTTGLEEAFVTWIDTDKLEKITNNLLSNAMKVTPANRGQIDVEFDVVEADEAASLAAKAGQNLPKTLPHMKLVVADNGPGLPPTELDRIFDRYYQLHDQASGVTRGGTGIGLYYSRALARLHHGCLFAENRTSDEHPTGARFTMLIPVGDEAYAASERITAAPTIATTPIVAITPQTDDTQKEGRTTILVVDDDSDVTTYLKTLLSPHYNVLVAYNAETAYTTAVEQLPDLILSDVIMPGTDGYDLCRKMKNDLQISHIPVILVTAKAAVENQVEGLNTGADAYVTKPFDPKYLLALIKSQLTNRQKARHMLSEATEIDTIEPDVLSGPDKAFMDELYKLMETELGNPEFDIQLISSQMHISRTKLFYKIKGLTGSTPAVFFKTYKLNRAAELIAQGNNTMSEIASITGFSTQAHFSTSFKKQFGVSPSAYTPRAK